MKPPQLPQNRLIVEDHEEGLTREQDDGREHARPSTPYQARTSVPAEAGVDTERRGKGPYPNRRQVTAHIPRQLFLWLKSISAQTDKPMVEIFEEALTAYVNSFAAGKKFGG